jgi:DUF971 family protein
LHQCREQNRQRQGESTQNHQKTGETLSFKRGKQRDDFLPQESALVLGASRETDIMSDIWPTELRVSKDRHRLTVTFNDGNSFDLSAEMLRVLSPSAEVQGHGPGQGLTVPGKRNVSIISMTPTGNYAVRIGFDDFHDTGIFTWNYLRELGENGETLFAAYERDLVEKGMSRDKAEKPR